MHGVMSKIWIYQRSKSELIIELEILRVSIEGTIDDQRRRLSRFVSQHPEMFPSSQNDPDHLTAAATASNYPPVSMLNVAEFRTSARPPLPSSH